MAECRCLHPAWSPPPRLSTILRFGGPSLRDEPGRGAAEAGHAVREGDHLYADDVAEGVADLHRGGCHGDDFVHCACRVLLAYGDAVVAEPAAGWRHEGRDWLDQGGHERVLPGWA